MAGKAGVLFEMTSASSHSIIRNTCVSQPLTSDETCHIADVSTDYAFALDLILGDSPAYEEFKEIHALGWASLMFGIVGMALAYCKLLVHRKMHKSIDDVREEVRAGSTSKLDAIHEIRPRQVDVAMCGLLICALEDAPQTLIAITVTTSTSEWTTIAVISISWGMQTISMTYYTCVSFRFY